MINYRAHDIYPTSVECQYCGHVNDCPSDIAEHGIVECEGLVENENGRAVLCRTEIKVEPEYICSKPGRYGCGDCIGCDEWADKMMVE